METPTMEGSGIRHELVARVKRDIQAGIYETSAKFETALERMLDDMAE